MNIRLLVLLVLSSFALTNCVEPVVEVKDTIYAAEDNSHAETHFFSTYEAIYDIVSTHGKLQKAESTILPASTKIEFIDSLFTDGNGITFIVDFGPIGGSEPKGVLCQDGRYRAGKMLITASGKFLSPDLKVTVVINKEDQYFTGNGSEMAQVVSNTTISKLSLTSLQIVISDAKIITKNYELPWGSTRIIEMVSDKGIGIWGDVYKVTGKAHGTNRFNEAYEVSIQEPLIKKMEAGCAQTFIKGKLEVSVTNTNKVIKINYDPNQDGACDLLAEADILGKKTIYTIK